MRLSSSALPAALLERATRPYRASGRYAWHFARGKLARDPVFAGLLQRGLITSGSHVLDLGCGQGLLAALLLAADAAQGTSGWPAHWAEPPRGVTLHGIELAPRDVRRARIALGASAQRARVHFEHGDIGAAAFGPADVVVLLDVLHYLDFAAQRRVLARVRDCLRPDGTLLLRVADGQACWHARFSHLVDRLVLAARAQPGPARLCGRPLAAWQRVLSGLGFSVETVPMHAGTPFLNMLLVGRLAEGAHARQQETP